MSEITLVRQSDQVITSADKDAARRVLFGIVDGLGELHKKRWRRFVNTLMQLEPGEMVELSTNKERLGWYHRKHMALETRVFESQERVSEFKQFRYWLKVGAGLVDWMPGPKGGVVPCPKSISYGSMEQGEMQEFHENAVAFLRTEPAAKYLWPKANALRAMNDLDLLLAEFNE